MRTTGKIKIGAREIKIIHKKMKDLGIAHYDRSEIWLQKGIAKEAQEAVLIHEIGHFLNSTMSHAVWDSLSEQLYATLKINKMLK